MLECEHDTGILLLSLVERDRCGPAWAVRCSRDAVSIGLQSASCLVWQAGVVTVRLVVVVAQPVARSFSLDA